MSRYGDEPSWVVTFNPGDAAPVTGYGRTLAVAVDNCKRAAETQVARAVEVRDALTEGSTP